MPDDLYAAVILRPHIDVRILCLKRLLDVLERDDETPGGKNRQRNISQRCCRFLPGLGRLAFTGTKTQAKYQAGDESE
jgi:hypothetical protein